VLEEKIEVRSLGGYDILVDGVQSNIYDSREFQTVIECVRAAGIEFFYQPVYVVKTLVGKGVAHYYAHYHTVHGFTAELSVIVRAEGDDPTLVITASTPTGEITRTVVVRR